MSRSLRHRRLSCNKPVKSWKPEKKKAVKACSRGKEKIIHFGATGYGNNYSSTARRSFRARHKCDSATDKLTARYWACKNLWTKGGDTRKCPSSRKCKYNRSRRIPARKSLVKNRTRRYRSVKLRRKRSRSHRRSRRK